MEEEYECEVELNAELMEWLEEQKDLAKKKCGLNLTDSDIIKIALRMYKEETEEIGMEKFIEKLEKLRE
ncbi:MAG: hypothetical protein HZR80_15150 [Candidatus Heimdallarchaeota archaeon]